VEFAFPLTDAEFAADGGKEETEDAEPPPEPAIGDRFVGLATVRADRFRFRFRERPEPEETEEEEVREICPGV
jgi:hypothetical protein